MGSGIRTCGVCKDFRAERKKTWRGLCLIDGSPHHKNEVCARNDRVPTLQRTLGGD